VVGTEELAIRLYLLVRFAIDKSPKELLYAHGKALVCPLPSECHKIVEKQGLKVGIVQSSFAWCS
jgi:hypothetical protein